MCHSILHSKEDTQGSRLHARWHSGKDLTVRETWKREDGKQSICVWKKKRLLLIELEPSHKEARKNFPKDRHEHGTECSMRWWVLFHWIIWEGLGALDLGWETFSCKGPDRKCLWAIWPLLQVGDSVIVWKPTQVMCTGVGVAVFHWNYLQKSVTGWAWLEHVHQSASPCPGPLLCNKWSTDKHPQYHLGAR